MTDRQFILQPAVRERVPLLVGLSGPSGSGKTYSALELATGMQEAVGKDKPIIFIDTENRRSLHYADKFDFQHMDLGAPFGSLDYLAALEYAASQDPAVIIVDSMSHEHEGPGGLIDSHGRILAERVARAKKNGDKRSEWQIEAAMQMLAWSKPKSSRRALLNGLVRLNQNVIMCFRSGEKSKPVKGKNGKQEVVAQGFTPIAGPEFVYEMTLSALLYPGAKGVPTWESDKPGEHGATKLPGQFYNLFQQGGALNRSHGQTLAEWARGGAEPKQKAGSIDIDALRAEGEQAAELGMTFLSAFWKRQTPAVQKLLEGIKDDTWKPMAIKADAKIDEEENEGVEL